MCPPINVNVLPARLSLQLIATPTNDATPTYSRYTESTMVHGPLDVAVEEYTKW
jgi:hypothetical protein